MISHTFEARIVNGQVVPADALKPFEGRQVHVTVSMPEAPPPVSPPAASEDDPEAPDDMDVAKEVYVRLPFQSRAVRNPVIRKGCGAVIEAERDR